LLISSRFLGSEDHVIDKWLQLRRPTSVIGGRTTCQGRKLRQTSFNAEGAFFAM
jgi:hypothetical protein